MKTRRITAVALLLPNGEVISMIPPSRHPCLFLRCQANNLTTAGAIQGFLDNNGEFLDREQASEVAEEANQLLPGAKTRGFLFSEDLW